MVDVTDADDTVRLAVARIKQLACTRVPPYELPADSFLQDAAWYILQLGERAGLEKAAKVADDTSMNDEIATAIRALKDTDHG